MLSRTADDELSALRAVGYPLCNFRMRRLRGLRTRFVAEECPQVEYRSQIAECAGAKPRTELD